MAESFHYSYETIKKLLASYIPKQIKSKKKKKKKNIKVTKRKLIKKSGK